jgi:hypothetical protein
MKKNDGRLTRIAGLPIKDSDVVNCPTPVADLHKYFCGVIRIARYTHFPLLQDRSVAGDLLISVSPTLHSIGCFCYAVRQRRLILTLTPRGSTVRRRCGARNRLPSSRFCGSPDARQSSVTVPVAPWNVTEATITHLSLSTRDRLR